MIKVKEKRIFLMDEDVGLQSTGYRSQAVITQEGFVFVAGQIGAKPDSKDVISPSMYDQSIQCFLNLEQVMKKAGGSRDDIVQMHVYITDKDLYPEFNQASKDFFGPKPPTRSVIGAPFLAGEALVEISVIGYLQK